MTRRTVDIPVARGAEMGMDARPAMGPMAPVDVAEPDIGSEEMLINIGPQHPATHGVLRLICELDGETVVSVTPHIGYLHSSFEKLGEYRTYNQIVPLTDRMDYLAPLIYNCAYAMAVEKLMGIEVTERCKVVRVICLELDRSSRTCSGWAPPPSMSEPSPPSCTHSRSASASTSCTKS